MPRKRNEDIFPGYYRCGKVDSKLLADVTRAAMGGRGVRQFAHLCEVSPSTISRILNGGVKSPISYTLSRAIAENAMPKSKITLHDVLTAQGYVQVKTEKTDDTDSTGVCFISSASINGSPLNEEFLKILKRFRTDIETLHQDKIRRIIQSELIVEGVGIKLEKNYKLFNAGSFSYEVPFAYHYGLGECNLIFAYDIHYSDKQSLTEKLLSLLGIAYASSFLEKRIVLNLITDSQSEYDKVKVNFKNIIVKDRINIILVNSEKEIIEDSFELPMTCPEEVSKRAEELFRDTLLMGTSLMHDLSHLSPHRPNGVFIQTSSPQRTMDIRKTLNRLKETSKKGG